MGLNKGPFVVADTVSVEGSPYTMQTEGVVSLPSDGTPIDVLSVDVCVHGSQVCIDSMIQVAVGMSNFGNTTFSVKYDILRNGDCIATINDEMDYEAVPADGRHTNFPSIPVVDENPVSGLNKYVLRCTNQSPLPFPNVFIGSRSLKASVIPI
ncbi:hypothetical protein [Chengkuizengella sediminis]|uniref:hypothetical protein n=1 Tax=Chengkuizengella sediminis TaxID=1885917 RepID=UPI0013897A31|nr:hypothetical protein [Chengkuizengella sediminis]NDI33617.1 hypothetical protein [Chengkuizengella sediminis]